MLTALLIIFLLGFAALAWFRLKWALLLLIAALPAYLIRFNVLGLPATLLEAMILISFAVWLGQSFRNKTSPALREPNGKLYPFAWEAWLVILIALLAAGVAGFNHGALGIWKAYFLEPVLLFIMIYKVFPKIADQLKVGAALLVSALAVSLPAIFQKLTGLFIGNPLWAAAATRRAVSWFGYPNAVGLYLAPLSLLFVGGLFYYIYQAGRKDRTRLWTVISIALTIVISWLAIYSARSEGALLGVAAGLLFFGLFAGRRTRLITLGLLALIIAGTFWLAPTKNFVLTKLTMRDLSGQIRLQQWKETWTMLSQGRLLTGAGLDNYQAAIKPYHQAGIFFNSDNMPNFDSRLYGSAVLRAKYWQPVEIYMYPHNILLNFWSELGILGVLLFGWIIGKYLTASLKLNQALERAANPEKYLALGLAAAMVAIVIHGLVDVPYFKNDLAAMFWIFLALLGNLWTARLQK